MSTEEDRTSKIEQFTGVTGAAAEFASSFLEATGWNVNQALDMYLGGGGNQAQTMTQAAPISPEEARRRQERQEQIMTRARKIMEEQNVDQSTALAIAEAQGVEQPQVRAPIAQTTDRLIDHEPIRNVTGPQDFLFNRMENEMRELREQMRVNVSNGGLSVAFNNSQMEGNMENTENGGQSSNLQDLFSPPREIIFQGTWEQAKDFAKEGNRWILVNIQKDSEFLSYNLNRDLWCNEIVKDLIQTSFVFFQHEDTAREAQTYKTFYNPSRYPHVAIVDPFTGELMREIELSPYQNDSSDLLAAFLEVTNNFLDNNLLEGEKIKRMQEMVKQRNKAKNTQANTTAGLPVSSNAIPPAAVSGGNTTDVDVQILEEMEDLEEEPPAGPHVAMIRFQLFGKKTVKRRFLKTQKVKDLFLFVRKEVEEARTKPFDLICYPNKSLKDRQESTIVDEKLVSTNLQAAFL